MRYQEARHVGEALTREAVRTLATTVDVPASSTIVVNSTARDRAGVVARPAAGERSGAPGRARRRRPVSHAGRAHHDDRRGHLDRRRRPEDPLGAGDDARPRAGGRPHRTESSTRHCPTAVTSSPSTTPRPARPRSTSRATKEQLLALGEAGATISIRQRRAPVRDVLVATDTVPGFGWRSYRAVEGEGPATAVRAEGLELANEHVRVGGRPHRRHAHGDRRRRHRGGLQPLRRRRRRRRHLQLLAARGRPRGRSTRVGRGDGRRVGSGSGPDRSHRTLRTPAHARSATSAPCTRAQRRTHPDRHRHHLRGAHRRALRAGARGARPPRPRPPPARPLPAAGARRRFPRRVRVRGRAPRSHRRGRPPRVRAPHLRVPPLRRLLGCR